MPGRLPNRLNGDHENSVHRQPVRRARLPDGPADGRRRSRARGRDRHRCRDGARTAAPRLHDLDRGAEPQRGRRRTHPGQRRAACQPRGATRPRCRPPVRRPLGPSSARPDPRGDRLAPRHRDQRDHRAGRPGGRLCDRSGRSPAASHPRTGSRRNSSGCPRDRSSTTLGTVFNDPELVRSVLDAIQDLPISIAVTTGPGTDPSILGPRPANIAAASGCCPTTSPGTSPRRRVVGPRRPRLHQSCHRVEVRDRSHALGRGRARRPRRPRLRHTAGRVTARSRGTPDAGRPGSPRP